MLKHEFFHYVILRHALAIDNGFEPLGRPTTWGALGNAVREAGLDANGRDPMDPLMQLSSRKAIILKKIHSDGVRWILFDYADYPRKNEFFWGEFGLFVTPEGAAYFDQLEMKVHAARSAATPAKETKIGFHA